MSRPQPARDRARRYLRGLLERLQPGASLPSIEAMVRRAGVAEGTLMTALREFEAAGAVVAPGETIGWRKAGAAIDLKARLVVKAHVRARLVQINAHDRVGTEQGIAAELGTALVTVRAALLELAAAGEVYSGGRGRGPNSGWRKAPGGPAAAAPNITHTPSGGARSHGRGTAMASAEELRSTVLRAIEFANDAIGALALAAEKLGDAETALGEAVQGSAQLEAAQAHELMMQAKQAVEEVQSTIGAAVQTAESYASSV